MLVSVQAWIRYEVDKVTRILDLQKLRSDRDSGMTGMQAS